MRRLVALAIMAVYSAIACSKFDDSAIWDKLNEHENRLAYLEEVCKKMNTDIVNLQTIVTALETNDYIVNASPLATGDGYTFIFKSGKSVVIYNGKNGVDGTNGVDGKDGVTPTISVMKDIDGIYYWTVNNEWLLVNGQKVKAAATDGKDGENGVDGANGKDGITPKFKIEEDYWYISYDNGESWEKLGKATGNDGQNGNNGIDGDSLFSEITILDGYVVFTLNDETGSKIKLQYATEDNVILTVTNPSTLYKVLTIEQERSAIKLTINGEINNEDILYIKYHMPQIESLDLSNTTISKLETGSLSNLTKLKKLTLPQTCATINDGSLDGCHILETLIAPFAKITSLKDFRYLKYLEVGNIDLWGSTLPDISKVAIKLNGDINGDVDSRGYVTRINKLIFGENVKTITAHYLLPDEIEFDDNCNVMSIYPFWWRNLSTYPGDNPFLHTVRFGCKMKELKNRRSDYALFYGCDSLTTVIIPDNSELETITGKIFDACPLLKTVSIPGSTVKIDGDLGSRVDTLIFKPSKYNLVLSGSNGYLFQSTHPSVIISHRSIPPYYSSTQTLTMKQHLSSYVDKMTLYVPEENYNDYLRSKSDYCYWGYIGKIKLISELE